MAPDIYLGIDARRVDIGKFRLATAARAIALVVCCGSSSTCLASGDPVRGEAVYQGCMDCHSLDENDVGPKHAGVFGRKAGAVPDYHYSDALKNSGIVWTEETLDKWLKDPEALVPGTKMFYSVENAQDRADVIAFLKQKSAQ